MGEIHADYDQMDLLPQSLEDWVAADHPARFIREFVDALDLPGLGFVGRQREEGRPSYADELLLKVWEYGYLSRIRSTRELERACREHMALIWLTGRHAPDHNTLWRFFHENRPALRKVFRASVQVAAGQGLVGMICHAVDGTKIRAVASRRKVEHRKNLEKALGEVEASIAAMEAAVEKAEEQETGEYRLPEGLQQAAELRRAIRASLARMQALQRDHLPRQEADARVMPCEGNKDPAYNAQAVADAQAGILVAQTAVNEEADNHRLVPMIKEVEANLGKVAEQTVADGGYASVEQLAEAEAGGYEVVVSPGVETGGQKRGEYDPVHFAYDRERDEVICPRGERLKFEGRKKKGERQEAVRVYRCQVYAQCPVRALCTRSKKGRTIERSPRQGALERQREKRQDPAMRALLRQRKAIIEPAFATIKQAMGFRRWTVRGLENVRTQWSLLCTALNLGKLYQHWLKSVCAGA